MADVVVSSVLGKLAAIMEKQIRDEINLVRGVKKEVRYLSSELTAIRNVLEDAERREYKDKRIQHWLKNLEGICYDVDDVLDEWSYQILKLQIERSEYFVVPQLKKVCSFVPFSCLCFREVKTRRDIALKIKRLKERLDIIVKEKDRYNFIVGVERHFECPSPEASSSSVVDSSEIYGREADKDVLVRKLMQKGAGPDGSAPDVISVVGAAGVGKTALAKLIFNDDRVENFFELRVWVRVSNDFNLVMIATGIVESAKRSSPNLSELDALLKYVTDCISGQRFLLVLDHVWTENYNKWELLKNTLKCGGCGSKVLVTTRSERVARMMGTTEIYCLQQLSDEYCCLLMHCVAWPLNDIIPLPKELEDIGRSIAKKCKGLPLAAKVLGCVLRLTHNPQEWKNILNSEIWQLAEAETDLFPKLFLSYNELSPELKRCFSYCAIFPKDSIMHVEKLIRMWMGLGYLSYRGTREDELEFSGEHYIGVLRSRYLLEYSGGFSVKMHDITHDFAQFVRKTRTPVLEDVNASVVPQIQVYRSLVCQTEFPTHLPESITCIRVLSLCECGLREIPEYVEKLIHLRYLDLSGNKEMEQVPETICKLYNLQTLYLSDCGLKEIPKEIGNLIKLRHLDLESNGGIEELPENICNLKELRTLNLAYCARLSRLPKGMHKLEKLISLTTNGTQLRVRSALFI